MQIAVLEDDLDQQDFISACLEPDGHTLIHLEKGSDLFRLLQVERFDMLILDWHLPDASGLDIITQLQSGYGWYQPILFITSSQSETDVVMALKQGADDFLAKPLRPAELRARVAALGRRSRPLSDQGLIRLGRYVCDLKRRLISLDEQEVGLTDREFRLASLFFSAPGQLLSRAFLMEMVWGLPKEVQTRTLDTHISRIRQKLRLNGEGGLRIRSVYQFGYRLEPVEGG